MGLVITDEARRLIDAIKKRFDLAAVTATTASDGSGRISGGTIMHSSILSVPFPNERIMYDTLRALAGEQRAVMDEAEWFTDEIGNYVNIFVLVVHVYGTDVPYAIFVNGEDAELTLKRLDPIFMPSIEGARLHVSLNGEIGRLKITADR